MGLLRFTIGDTKCVFHIDEQSYSHNNCNHIEDSLCRADDSKTCAGVLPSLILQLDSQGDLEKPGIKET